MEITVLEDVYHMHSTQLRHNSAVFDKSLSEPWWKPNTHRGPDGIRYRYQLSLDKDMPELSMVEPVAAQDDMTDAVEPTVVPPSPIPEPTHPSLPSPESAYSSPLSSESAHPSPKVLEIATQKLGTAYSTLFGVYYNRAPDISSLKLPDIDALVSLADQYCSLPHLAGTIELLLMAWARCYGRIQEQPIEVLLLVNKIRSKLLFNEAFAHLVGRLGDHWDRQNELPPEVLGLVLDERHLLARYRADVGREAATFAATHKPFASRSEIGQLASLFRRYGKCGYARTMYKGIENIVSRKKGYKGSKLMEGLGFLLRDELRIQDITYSHLTCAQLGDLYPWDDAEDW